MNKFRTLEQHKKILLNSKKVKYSQHIKKINYESINAKIIQFQKRK